MIDKIEISIVRSRVRFALNRLAKGLGDMRPAWRQALPLISQELVLNAQSRGSRAGASWPALEQATIRRKRREGRGRAQLNWTGATLRDLGSPRKIKRGLAKRKLRVGLKKDYQNALQRERPVIALTPRMIRATFRAVDSHVGRLLKTAEDVINAGG